MYAKIKSRNTVKGTRYTYEYKEIAPGQKVRWPYNNLGLYSTRDGAVRAVEAEGGVVVKTWDEAMGLANVYKFDSRYYSIGEEPK